MKLLLFGMLAEDIGKQEIVLETFRDVNSLRKYLLEHYPILRNKQFMIAVNKQKADKNITLSENDEIALIPPFAGG
jgi:molybdopterin synthase sulfur carrier subunit